MKMTEEQKIKENLNKMSKDQLVELIFQLLFDKRAMQAKIDAQKDLKKS